MNTPETQNAFSPLRFLSSGRQAAHTTELPEPYSTLDVPIVNMAEELSWLRVERYEGREAHDPAAVLKRLEEKPGTLYLAIQHALENGVGSGPDDLSVTQSLRRVSFNSFDKSAPNGGEFVEHFVLQPNPNRAPLIDAVTGRPELRGSLHILDNGSKKLRNVLTGINRAVANRHYDTERLIISPIEGSEVDVSAVDITRETSTARISRLIVDQSSAIDRFYRDQESTAPTTEV